MMSLSSKLFVPQSDSRTHFGLQREHTERTHTLSGTSRGTPVSTGKSAQRSSNSRLPSNNRIVSRKADQGTRAVVSPPVLVAALSYQAADFGKLLLLLFTGKR